MDPIQFYSATTFVELFVSWAWMELKQVHHSHLRKLVWELPRIVLCDRASSTTSKYMGSFKRWSHWASSYGIPSIPADAKFLALYLADVLKNSKSPSPVLATLYGVSWAHQKALLEDPSKHPLVTQVVDAAKRLLAHPVQKKRPLTINLNLADGCSDCPRLCRISPME